MDREEIEAAPARTQNLVMVLPQSLTSVPRFLTGPLEHVDPVTGGLQLLVLTTDAETAVALAETVLGMTGPAGIELFPVTSARRAARLIKGRPILALAGVPGDVAELITGTHIRLGGVKTVVLAWPDDLLEDPETRAALESVMAELPKTSTRIVVTSQPTPPLDAFVERYMRRARRIGEDASDRVQTPIPVQYVTTAPGTRDAVLRRLLDDLDPPSFAVVVQSAEEQALVERPFRTLGYAPDGAPKVTTGDVAPGTHTVIFYGPPLNAERIEAAVKAGAVQLIALIRPSEIRTLKRVSGGDAKPLPLATASNLARQRERTIRRELSAVLEEGIGSREIGALEPLLESHDGIEIAAAALRLLVRERSVKNAPSPAPPSRDTSGARQRFDRAGGERGTRGREDRGPRKDRGPRPEAREKPRFSDRGDRPTRPDRDRSRGSDDRTGRPEWRSGPRPPRGGRE